MGYTAFSKQLVEKHLTPGIHWVLDFGTCRDYTQPGLPYIQDWFTHLGILYSSIDLTGENNSWQYNWSYPIISGARFDLITDFGSSEHSALADEYTTVEFDNNIKSVYPKDAKDTLLAYYNCWLNKFNFCKVGGLIISENPKQGNWPGHGFSYITRMFYAQLEEYSGLSIVDIGEEPATGNTIDGWNIFSVLKKESDTFPSFGIFSKFDITDK